MATKFIEKFILEQNIPYNTDTIVDSFYSTLEPLDNSQLTDILISDIYIPDYYDHDSSEETLFTKLVEVLTSFIFNKINIKCEYLKQKSGTEDIHISLDDNKINVVGDVKTYRLGRSQKAANVKDFIKPADFKEIWGKKYEKLGKTYGLVIFPSTHEWKKTSDVYQHCTNPDFPIVIMHFSHLAVLLNNYPDNSNLNFCTLWDYTNLQKENTKNKEDYWEFFNKKFEKLFTNINVPELLTMYENEIQTSIKIIIKEYEKKEKDEEEKIAEKISSLDEAEARELLTKLLTEKKINKINSDIKRIKKFRLIDSSNDK